MEPGEACRCQTARIRSLHLFLIQYISDQIQGKRGIRAPSQGPVLFCTCLPYRHVHVFSETRLSTEMDPEHAPIYHGIFYTIK